MSTRLNVHESLLPCGTVLRITGPMTVQNVPDLERVFDRLAAERRPLVVLELSGVPVAGSLAMGMMLRFSRAARQWGGVVRLCGLRTEVADSIRRARLDLVLTIAPTLDDALGPAHHAATDDNTATKC